MIVVFDHVAQKRGRTIHVIDDYIDVAIVE